MVLYIEILDKDKHDRTNFQCVENMMNNFLKLSSSKQRKENYTQIYILTDGVINKDSKKARILGFFTLCTHSIENYEDKVSYDSLPATLLGMLAVDKRFERMKIATNIIKACLKVNFIINNIVATTCLVVEPLNSDIKKYYLGLGFEDIDGSDDKLMFSIKNTEALFSELNCLEEEVVLDDFMKYLNNDKFLYEFSA